MSETAHMSNKAAPKGSVLLLGNYRTTIACARRLSEHGYRVIVGHGGDLRGGALHSRACAEVWQHPPASQPEALVNALNRFIGARDDLAVLMPVAEDYVRFLTEYGDRLTPGPVHAVTDPVSVRTLLDKKKAFGLAEKLGVPVAPFAEVSDMAALRQVAGTIGWPLVIRPEESSNRLMGDKVLIAGSMEALEELMPHWPRGHARLLLQRWVAGKPHHLFFAARKGQLLRLLEAEILRTDRIDGTGLSIEGITRKPNPELADYVARFADALGYNGVGSAQFLIDDQGQVHFLEINPRFGGNHAAAERAGLDLTRLAIDLARNSADDEPYKEGVAGIRYAWTHGGLGCVRGLLRAGPSGWRAVPGVLAQLVIAALRADMHLSWSWRDPMPTLAAYAESFVPHALRRHKPPAPQVKELKSHG